MKMSKFRIAVLVLLAVTTVVYAVTLQQSVQAYNEWRQEDGQKYAEQYQGYVPSYTHFLTTKTGIVFDVVGITLFFAWSFAILSKNKKASLTTTFLILSISCAALLSPNVLVVRGNPETPTIKVGLLICYDQELLDKEWDWWIFTSYSRELLFCNNHFRENFGIELVYDSTGDWIKWDSDDALYFMDELLQDAIDKTGFHSGEVRDGIRRDVLFCLTGQDTNQLGWSYPVWNASILRYYVPMTANSANIQHELSHQFELGPGHCDNYCVMNDDYIVRFGIELPDVWCESCFQELNSMKFRFTIVGDVNGDYKVDIMDISIAAHAYGSQEGDADWVPSCDINGDRKIDIIDLNAIAAHFGESRY